MTILDANYILRWFLGDITDQAQAADKLISTASAASIQIDPITIAEVTYVLRAQGYDHRQIHKLFEELLIYTSIVNPGDLCMSALSLYRDTTLDFEDCVLVAYHKVRGYDVATFDKQVQRLTVPH